MRIERIGPIDLTVLAADRGAVPTNLGVVLLSEESAPVPADLLELLRTRVPRIPRLRQVLRRTPLGCGRPVWADDPSFTVDHHVTVAECPGDDLLGVAASLLCRSLDPRRPLWRAVLATGTGRNAQNRLNPSGSRGDHSTVRFGSGAGPRL